MRILSGTLVIACVVGLSGCSVVTRVGVKLLYRRADLPAAQIIRDVCYAPAAACDNPHRLDLYLPAGRDWPVMLFVHGGNWTEGDKSLRAGGADVYANVGRFYASQGIGVAVINYRLQPATDWRGQVADARQATRWIHDHIREHGGRPDDIFLMGHSAGGYLSAFVALDTTSPDFTPVRGAIIVSGAGLDIADSKTYELGESRTYYEKRFRGQDATEQWKTVASPVHYVTRAAPPFLILHSGGEKPALKRQAHLLEDALRQQGANVRLTVVPGESHSRIVLTLSRPDKTAGPAILEFVRREWMSRP